MYERVYVKNKQNVVINPMTNNTYAISCKSAKQKQNETILNKVIYNKRVNNFLTLIANLEANVW